MDKQFPKVAAAAVGLLLLLELGVLVAAAAVVAAVEQHGVGSPRNLLLYAFH